MRAVQSQIYIHVAIMFFYISGCVRLQDMRKEKFIQEASMYVYMFLKHVAHRTCINKLSVIPIIDF